MDAGVPERCVECGFDVDDWRVRDAASLFGALGSWWRMAVDGVDVSDLNRRPGPVVWSALEYGLHTSLVTAVIREGVEAILAENECLLPAVPAMGDAGTDDGLALDVDSVLDALEREGEALAQVATRRGVRWANVGRLPDGGDVQAGAVLFHAAHDASHHFMDVARGMSVLAIGTPAGCGTVAGVSASDGGVPKRPVASADVSRRGLVGDRQADRKHHGRPFQALCLWSADVIDELVAQGHSIAPGCAGENVTVRGIDWSSLRSGTLVRVGSALVELSYPAVPCHKQARWFNDGDFERISYERNSQWVRWYAWVREPGHVEHGDTVAVQPSDDV